MTKDHRMGRKDNRTHKSGQVPITKFDKSSIKDTSQRKKWKASCCSMCGVVGHSKSKCRMPANKNQVTELAEFDLVMVTMIDEFLIKAPKRRKAIDYLVSVEEWM